MSAPQERHQDIEEPHEVRNTLQERLVPGLNAVAQKLGFTIHSLFVPIQDFVVEQWAHHQTGSVLIDNKGSLVALRR